MSSLSITPSWRVDSKLGRKLLNKNKDFSRKLIEASTESQKADSAKKQEKENEKENIVTDQSKMLDSINNKEDYSSINDITGYTTKNRRNLVDNNSRIIQSNSTFLQELNIEDDLLCNTEANEEIHPKSVQDNSIIERAISAKSQKPPSHPQKSIPCTSTSKCTNYETKERIEGRKISKSPSLRPKWKGFGPGNDNSLVS